MGSEPYTVVLTDQAKKDIRSHRAHIEQISLELEKLKQNPELGHALSGGLRSCRALSFTTKGSGAFRAIYLLIPEESVCLVFIVGPHENIYAKAERRVKAFD